MGGSWGFVLAVGQQVVEAHAQLLYIGFRIHA